MTPEKDFCTELGHYFNMRITEENERRIEKMLKAYIEKIPREKEKIIVHVPTARR